MDDLASLLGPVPAWCELGLVVTPPAPSPADASAVAARHVQVQLVPSGRLCDARVANLGQGNGRGVFAMPQPGDEVLVLFPGGDPNRAVAIGGLGSAKALNPVENTGLALLLLHPGGVQLLGSTGQPLNGIVHGGFLQDFAAYVAALEGFMTTISTATTAPQIAAAALTFLTAVSSTVPPTPVAPSDLATKLAASSASGTPPGVGGPPYATSLHKVSP